MSNVVEQIALYQRKLEKYAKTKETDKLLYYIHKLKYLNVTVSHLEETGVGRTVNALRHYEGLVGEKARALVNKWKVMVTAEEEEDEEEGEADVEEDEGDERDNASPVAPRRGEERHNTEDQESEGGDDDEEEDRLQIEEDDKVEYEDEGDGYGYSPHDSPAGVKIGGGYGNDSASGGEDSDGYNPVTSQRDYQLHSKGPVVAAEYHPSQSRIDPVGVSSPSWKDSSPDGSSDRKNGSSTKSSSKKSHREDKEKYKEKERIRERERIKHKDSLSSHEKEKRKEHKEKRKDKHRDREEKREEKEKVKSHKDKHKDRDKHNVKPKEHKLKSEEYSEKSKSGKELEKGIVNGFSTPEVEKRPYDGKLDSRESDKRHVVEKRKDKSDKSNSSHRKEDSASRDRDIMHKENRLSESIREAENISKESSREKDIKDKERRKEEKHRDRNRDSSSISSSKKEKSKKEPDSKKYQREQDDSENDRKDSKKKKNKKNVADDNIGFGAALMGFDSPVKRKKKKKKKDQERERESSDDERPSTSKLSNKRIHTDGGGLPDPKKPKLLMDSPPKLPHIPTFSGSLVPDDGPLLPEITPNYKPLPRVPIRDDPADHMTSKMSEEEALNIMFQSKNNRRSKMYSGKVPGLSYVPTLYESCIRVLQENIDALEYTGGIPFEILRPVLERASPQQLINLEDFNSYLLEDTNVLWEVHCKRDFRNKKLEEMETWRDMWIRCFDEREQKLRNVTQNLQQKFISKAEPKRTTKLAFVGTTVKVPKSVARAQAKYGTGAPSVAAAKPGKANEKANEVAARKIAMQNVQRAERAANNPRPVSAKNKKVAPLMAKTRQLFKQAFRR
ncbi:uncharacterized protein EloA [Panulirus ornatus]|uniref:uncharacterized protein EloA n=1 Tax=Panulirus ornatus TaxID=150431 RepID=UPI003A83D6C2